MQTHPNLHLEYPPDLPVSQERERIVRAIRDHPVVIVCGDTGSGKTTQLPKMALEAQPDAKGKIGITQPRRLAAVGMARRVAEECRCPLGQAVGLRVRFENRTGHRTRLQFMTDGILLAQLPKDPDWRQYSTLIIDEAHERGLNIDFILGHLRMLLQRRPDLKVIISSATLDAERFSDFFRGAPVLSVQGRMYPVEDIHLPEAEQDDRDLPDQIADALRRLDRRHASPDTLVFLPGEREIRDTAKKLEPLYQNRAEILPLYARLSMADQQRAFSTGGRRRIILATNVAETSITLPGIRAVIDTGKVRVNRVHPQTGVQRLLTEQISQASAAQRRGRCGRTGPGVCLRLYSESTLLDAPAHSDPEIRRVSLAEVILRMAVLGLPPLTHFPLLDPPKGALIAEGYRTLREIGAMTRTRSLLPRGRLLASFPLEPRLARMLEEGHHENVLPALLVAAAFLSIQDPRERPAEKTEAADRAHAAWRDPSSDFLGILHLWNDLCSTPSRTQRRKFCIRNFLNPRRTEEWFNLVDDLRDICKQHRWPVPRSIGQMELADPDALHRSLLAGAPRRVGFRDENRSFLDPTGQRFLIFPGSALADKPPKQVMVFTLLETSRLFARECAALRPEWIEQVAPHLCRYHYERPRWNPKRGFVEADERVTLGQLTLRQGQTVHYGRIDPQAARDIFLQDALLPANLPLSHPSLDRYRSLLASLKHWEHKLRRPDYFTGAKPLLDYFTNLLPPDLCDAPAFQKWIHNKKWVPQIADLFPDEPLDENDYPDHIEVQGVPLTLHYLFAPDQPDADGLTLEVREEDLPALPSDILEWTAPAWLHEKVEALIRSLDKPLRALCNPAPATAREAVLWMREQNFLWTHSLHQALAAFLAAKLDRILAAPDFHPEKLPPHLLTRLRVVDDQGRVLHQGATFPGRSTPAGPLRSQRAGAWHQTGLTHFPDTPLPDHVEQQGRTRHPALVDEGDTCGIRLYTSPSEAEEAHRAGLARLFRLRRPDLVTHLQKKFPLPTSVQLDLAAMDGGSADALEDILDSVIREALDLSTHSPRDPQSFARAEEHARGHLHQIATRRGEQLRAIFTLRSQVREALDTPLPDPARADLDLQQTTLWAPGWARDPENLEQYPRYLRGILARIERLHRDTAKDAKKQERLEPALTLLANAADDLPPALLRQGFRKIEEFRLAIFAPEIKPREKMSPQRLERWLADL